ncbi:MAG TPA: AIPR family protein [Acidobacteriaceae bacterium]
MKDEVKLKEQFKDDLIQWVGTRLGTSFHNLNNTQQSRQMIQFFVNEVMERLTPGLVPDDEGELESCIIDGSGDGGADFLYRSDEGQVVIIQAKYRGKDAAETPESIGRLCDFLERLYLATEGKQQAIHKDLLELASQIDWAEDTFRLYFLTTAKTPPSVKDRVDQGLGAVSAFPDLIEERAELIYLDATGLNLEWREALSASEFSDRPIVIPMLPDANGIPWCEYDQDHRTLYVGEVSGAVLADILNTHRASLFTMNIRDYVGDTRTNKQIISTALHDPLNFEYFNNGVTAVAGKIMPDLQGQKLSCEKMSIINGAQTIRSLKAALTRKGSKLHKPLSKVRVLLRLISFHHPSEIPFVSEVTKYNNTQNAVKIADFRSNDEVQKDLGRRFKKLNLAGRDYEYKNKRAAKRRNTIPITLEELTKCLFAFRFGPDDMFGGTAKLFDSSSTGLYRKIFEDPEALLSEAEFNLIAGTYFACDFLKGLWEAHRKALRSSGQSMHPALERKGLVYSTVGELLRLNYAAAGWSLEPDLRRLSKPNDWLKDPNSVSRASLLKAFELATKVMVNVYDASRKSPAFKHRNWFRTSSTLTDIRSGLDIAMSYGTLPRIWG